MHSNQRHTGTVIKSNAPIAQVRYKRRNEPDDDEKEEDLEESKWDKEIHEGIVFATAVCKASLLQRNEMLKERGDGRELPKKFVPEKLEI